MKKKIVSLLKIHVLLSHHHHFVVRFFFNIPQSSHKKNYFFLSTSLFEKRNHHRCWLCVVSSLSLSVHNIDIIMYKHELGYWIVELKRLQKWQAKKILKIISLTWIREHIFQPIFTFFSIHSSINGWEGWVKLSGTNFFFPCSTIQVEGECNFLIILFLWYWSLNRKLKLHAILHTTTTTTDIKKNWMKLFTFRYSLNWKRFLPCYFFQFLFFIEQHRIWERKMLKAFFLEWNPEITKAI